jgi:hypothetical protein
MRVSSPIFKNISVFMHPKSDLELIPSHPERGAYHDRHETRGGMRWTRQRFARDGIAGQVERLVSDQQHADERRLLRTAKSCGPDAPTLASSLRSRVGPTGLRQNISADDGGNKARSPGRARRKPLKPLRAGMPGDSGVLVFSCAFYQYQSAHEPAGATGIRHSPRPLTGGRFMHDSGASRRGIMKLFPTRHRPRRRAIQYSRDADVGIERPRRTG